MDQFKSLVRKQQNNRGERQAARRSVVVVTSAEKASAHRESKVTPGAGGGRPPAWLNKTLEAFFRRMCAGGGSNRLIVCFRERAWTGGSAFGATRGGGEGGWGGEGMPAQRRGRSEIEAQLATCNIVGEGHAGRPTVSQ